MPVYSDKIKAGKKVMLQQKQADESNSKNPSLQLQDNRPHTAVQKKHVVAMANRQPAHASIQKKENTTGLPDDLRSGIENLSGHSMDNVKVHYNSTQPAQLNAYAYAQGTDIHIATGQEKHLPHEAWHVVQQKQGRVRPTMLMKGKVKINDDKGLEKEADMMGAKAMLTSTPVAPGYSNDVVQNKALVNSFASSPGKPVQRALTELNEPSMKGETRNDDLALRIDGHNWYTEMNSGIEVEYLPLTDQYRLRNGNFWDPVTTHIVIRRANNVYDSPDRLNHYNYVRGRYIPVGAANIGAEPALDAAMTIFIQNIWGARDTIAGLLTEQDKMNYIYTHFYAMNGGGKQEPAHSTPLIDQMVGLAEQAGGHIQFGVNIPGEGNIEDCTRLHQLIQSGNQAQRVAAYNGLAGKYYYFRIGHVAGNRRIVINTSPSQTPAEFIKVYNILIRYPAVVADIKVAGPKAAAHKMDTMVMYVNSGAAQFQAMVDALIVGGIITVDQLPAMLRPLAAGIGYAHEPAVLAGGTTISFGEKRVILAYMALQRSATLQQFSFLAGQFFEDAGIDSTHAHAEKTSRSVTVMAHLRAYLRIMSGR